MNDNFAPAIARTGCRLIARHNGRAFAVATPANSPARLCQSDLARVGAVFAVPSDAVPEASPVCSSFARGAGAAYAFGVAAPAVCISSHGSDDNAR